MANGKATEAQGPRRYGAELVELAQETAFRPRRGGEELDEADLSLIDALVRDGRTNNRSMVDITGLTEETVAVRIRNLIEREIIGITAVFDWSAAGYEWDAFLVIECGPGGIPGTVASLECLDRVISISTVLGSADLIVHVLCEDREALLEFVVNTLQRAEGIRNVHVMLSLDTVKFYHQFAWVPIEIRTLNFPKPVVELNDLDMAIIDALARNGRSSNREIGRTLGVSDGTVRSHLRRLESAGLLRICAQVHPARSGMVKARAFVGIRLQGVDAREFAAELAQVAEIVTISITTNHYQLFCYVLAKSRARLVEIVYDTIRPMEGVASTETWQVVDYAKHVSQWARW